MQKETKNSSPSTMAAVRDLMVWLNGLAKTERGQTRALVLVIVAAAHPEPIDLTEIERHGRFTGSPVTEALADWKSRGLIKLEPHPTDSRRKQARLTTKGERALNAMLGFFEEH